MSAAVTLFALTGSLEKSLLTAELLADDLNDPEAIEHAVIAALAVRHLGERARTLAEDQTGDELEVATA